MFFQVQYRPFAKPHGDPWGFFVRSINPMPRSQRATFGRSESKRRADPLPCVLLGELGARRF